jgi:hypothetical protein
MAATLEKSGEKAPHSTSSALKEKAAEVHFI